MRVRTLLTAVAAAASLTTARAEAQLVPMGQQGVVMGVVWDRGDVAKEKEFWAQLDGKPMTRGNLQLIQFKGAYVALANGTVNGGTEGSVMNHVGFNVKSMAEWLPKWQAAGIVQSTPRPTQTYLISPSGVRVEILEDANIPNSIQFHHYHYFSQAAPLDLQDWYFKEFGAAKGKRAAFDAGDLPGVNLTFSSSQTPVVGTQGRAVSAIGFEVKGLEAFAKKLAADGVTIEKPYGVMGSSGIAEVMIVDPWGTRISLTEGLAKMAPTN
jgi:hypothetical protein